MPDNTIPGIPQTTANGTEATPVPSPRPLSHSGAVQGGWFQRLQAFEDAVAYRRARVGAPCPDCGSAASGRRCDDHGRDLDLIDEYLHTIHLTTEYLRALHREYLQTVCHPLGSPVRRRAPIVHFRIWISRTRRS